jgi:hypothetical protein
LTNLESEAEARYVKRMKFSAWDVVEAPKEAAINFIIANTNEVLSLDTLKNIPESRDIIWDILCSVFTQHN